MSVNISLHIIFPHRSIAVNIHQSLNIHINFGELRLVNANTPHTNYTTEAFSVPPF